MPLLLLGALPMLAALGPLATVHGGLFGYRILCTVIVGASLLLLGRESWRTADRWLVAATASFAVSGLIGLMRVRPGSENPDAELLAVMLGLCTALALRPWQRRVAAIDVALARGWVLAGLLVCGFALWEVQTGFHLPGYPEDATPAPAAAFGNPNALGIFVVMANVWALVAKRGAGRRWRVTCWLLVVASAPVMYATGARLATAVWVLVLACSIWFDVRGSHRAGALAVAAALPVVAAISVLTIGPVVLGYATESANAESSGGVRQALSEKGLEFAVHERGLPTWPGSFEYFMAERGDPLVTGYLLNAHNSWVEILVQYGLISLLLFVGWLVACVATSGAHRGAVLVAVGALVVLGVVNSSSLEDSSFWLYVVTIAVVSRTPSRGDTRRRSEPQAVSA